MTESRIGWGLALGTLAAMLSSAGCSSGSESCTAVAEVCNGADDDCDGQVDEGFDLGAACTAGVGACAASGTRVCLAGAATCDAVPGEPAASETCDQVDEDCDGQIDEDVPGCCTPAAQRPCGSDEGACTAGTETCSAQGAWGACLDAGGEPVVLPGVAAEVCNGVDDDCDGQTDESVTDPSLGQTCDGADADGCREGVVFCGNGTLQCSDVSATNLETCNGLDDDCDGQTDEQPTDPTLGTACDGADGDLCQEGYWTCTSGSLQCGDVTGTQLEICNGADDDCDGQTDEEVVAPGCLVAGVCAAGTHACDGANGWICTYPAQYEPSEMTCDGLDNDCDGATDEGFPAPCL